jgi:hypothetical protein
MAERERAQPGRACEVGVCVCGGKGESTALQPHLENLVEVLDAELLAELVHQLHVVQIGQRVAICPLVLCYAEELLELRLSRLLALWEFATAARDRCVSERCIA